MLSEWLPKRIVNKPEDQAGAVIDSAYWRSLWALVIEQGDDTADTLKELLDALYASVWHPTDAATYITNPVLYEDGAETVAGQLAELLSHMDDAETDIATLDDLISDLTDGTTPAGDASLLGGALPAAYALAGDITDLQTQINNLAAGEIAAFEHNDIGTRDADDAHPMSAITGLTEAFADLAATDIYYSETHNVATKIAAMDAVLNAISGDVEEISHNDLANRNAANAHPTSAITGLDTALAGKQATIALTASRAVVSNGSGALAAATTTATEIGYVNGVTSAIQTQLNAKQKTITAGTADPSGGVDGDIYIKYA